ncbi:amidohydrolase family protein [Actinomadura montaniterrae]|uniref:Amidohydrolase n=1 Tax=Actinomadura montaniterrae TaxID=1803903 RepID=A0A6L3VW40_9ACTN|nr:amidohydrolase family protein [Actinomadura montaniterrae]KAB2381348.1 amidohydrolase [Actinomadura montaniterrae]
MLIVDAQVHAWSDGESTGHHRRPPITRAVLEKEMAEAGVHRAVLVPPLWDPSGNDYSLRLAQDAPDRFAVMGLLDPGIAEPAKAVRTWKEQPGMLGMRFLLNTEERVKPLLDGALDAVWPAAEEAGLTVALLIPGALDRVTGIARRHPDLRIIVDHLGVPRGASGPSAFAHLPELLALAAHPNVHVKAAGVGDYALDAYPFPSLDGTLRRVLGAFGPERIVWASDLSRLHHPYRRCVTHLAAALPELGEAELEMVMGGNIRRLLGWR